MVSRSSLRALFRRRAASLPLMAFCAIRSILLQSTPGLQARTVLFGLNAVLVEATGPTMQSQRVIHHEWLPVLAAPTIGLGPGFALADPSLPTARCPDSATVSRAPDGEATAVETLVVGLDKRKAQFALP